jgi:hypothetical protein
MKLHHNVESWILDEPVLICKIVDGDPVGFINVSSTDIITGILGTFSYLEVCLPL